jgi:glycosyltransferase involved in cell wall biosynthesis
VVVHSQHGRARLIAEAGVARDKITVIHHGAFEHLDELKPLAPPELSGTTPGPPAALLFGLLRPYKGLDVLYEAWRALGDVDAQLWVVGAPRMELPPAPPGVRVVPRFVSDAEAAWCLREAALVVLPYREIDQSGVLFSALGLGRPLLLSDAGAFPELGDAVAHVPAGDAPALTAQLRALLGDEAARASLATAARQAATSSYSWTAAATAHATLYARLAA